MPDIHASMLALHVPNVLPKYVPWIDFAAAQGHLHRPPLPVGPPHGPRDLVDAPVRDRPPRRLSPHEEAEAGRARHLGANDSRGVGRVGDDGHRLRDHPARMAHVLQLVPQLQHGDVHDEAEPDHPLRHHPLDRRRRRRHGDLRPRPHAAGDHVQQVAEARGRRGGPRRRARRRQRPTPAVPLAACSGAASAASRPTAGPSPRARPDGTYRREPADAGVLDLVRVAGGRPQVVDPGRQAEAVPPHRPGRVHPLRRVRRHLSVEVHPHALQRRDRRGRERRPAGRRPARPRVLHRRRRRVHPLRAVRRPVPDRRHHPGQGRRPVGGGRPERTQPTDTATPTASASGDKRHSGRTGNGT